MAHERLKAVIKEKRISVLQLSLRAGISPSSVYTAMQGKTPFYPSWRKRIAAVLEVDEADIFDDDSERG